MYNLKVSSQKPRTVLTRGLGRGTGRAGDIDQRVRLVHHQLDKFWRSVFRGDYSE